MMWFMRITFLHFLIFMVMFTVCLVRLLCYALEVYVKFWENVLVWDLSFHNGRTFWDMPFGFSFCTGWDWDWDSDWDWIELSYGVWDLDLMLICLWKSTLRSHMDVLEILKTLLACVWSFFLSGIRTSWIKPFKGYSRIWLWGFWKTTSMFWRLVYMFEFWWFWGFGCVLRSYKMNWWKTWFRKMFGGLRHHDVSMKWTQVSYWDANEILAKT